MRHVTDKFIGGTMEDAEYDDDFVDDDDFLEEEERSPEEIFGCEDDRDMFEGD